LASTRNRLLRVANIGLSRESPATAMSKTIGLQIDMQW
jgi:hypothetical protein